MNNWYLRTELNLVSTTVSYEVKKYEFIVILLQFHEGAYFPLPQ